MCGLVGVINLQNNSFKITEDYIVKMRDTMTHRGPDGHGLWISQDKNIGLGHRRLSIIDLSEAANQPMISSDKKIIISFNGEIYNHQELRNEINSLSTEKWLTSHSDTEVLLRAYKLWGLKCLDKLYGMFAIAIWDENLDSLFLVRDRIGIKPLYWSSHSGRVTFASEIKALLEDPDQKREVDEHAFQNYFSHICTPGSQTLFKGIKKLEPGTLVTISKSSGSIDVTTWYDLLDHVAPYSGNKESIYPSLLSSLKDAVEIRKLSDVPIGVFLSGGVDSSTNAVLFSENNEDPINTFSIGYDEKYGAYSNELEYAQLIAEQVESNHFEKLLSVDEVLDFLPEMIHLQDEPIGDPVCIPLYFVSKLAKDNGVTVCQVGEGADELFGGYAVWKQWVKVQDILGSKAGNLLRPLGLKIMEFTGYKYHRIYDVIKRSKDHRPAFWGGAEGLTSFERKMVFSGKSLENFNNFDEFNAIRPIWNNFKLKTHSKSSLSWMSYLDLKLRLPELLLMRVDKMSMGVSLEARVPFLDHRIVEMALGIPNNLKIKEGRSKHVLKEAVKKILPSSIIDRKKQGFGAPVHDWLLGDLGGRVRSELKSFCEDTDYFNFDGIEKLLSSKSRAHIWYIYNFMLWHRHYIDQKKI